jgi:xanthosine utilization system XapX-like protein
MFLSGYIFAFVIGVAVGFVFSNIILFGKRLDQTP